MGKLRVYCLKTLKKLSIYPLGKTPSAPSEETVVEAGSSSGEELEIEENEVAVPIPVPGQLVPIEEDIQVLPDELVGTQIAFELAEEDHPPTYE